MTDDFNLNGKAALITGASSGIGAATAVVLASLGARVTIGYHENREGADRVVRDIAGGGGRAIAISADMRNVDEIRRLVDEASKAVGSLDILVNNAGSLVRRFPLPQLTEDGWDEVL